MLETPEEMANLQGLLDASMASAGPHLRDVITDERRLTAEQLSERLQGMRLLVLATVTESSSPGRWVALQAGRRARWRRRTEPVAVLNQKVPCRK